MLISAFTRTVDHGHAPKSIPPVKSTCLCARPYCKAILCLLEYQQPESFDTNGVVILDNSNLKIAASGNYHHFFPKNCLSTNQPAKEPDLIANITLIDGYSNKHRIGKKAPSEYIGKFAKDNKSLSETLRTHLIKTEDTYGVNSDDCDAFIRHRARTIALALNVKLLSLILTPELVMRFFMICTTLWSRVPRKAG